MEPVTVGHGCTSLTYTSPVTCGTTVTTMSDSLAANRPPRIKHHPAYLVQDNEFNLPKSLLHGNEAGISQRPIHVDKPPSVCSRRTRSSASSSRSQIATRLAEQESLKKAQELKKAAEEESACIRFEAEQKQIQIDSNLKQAIIQLETERLQHELLIAEDIEREQRELSINSQGPDEYIQSMTYDWVNKVSNTFEPTRPVGSVAVACSNVIYSHAQPLQLLQPSVANLVHLRSYDGAAGVSVTKSMPLEFNPTLPPFVPNSVVSQGVRLFGGLPVMTQAPVVCVPVNDGCSNSRPISTQAPSRQSRGSRKGQLPQDINNTSFSEEEGSTPGYSSDGNDPSDGDSGKTCSNGGKSKAGNMPTVPATNPTQDPAQIMAGLLGYGCRIWDSLPRLDIPKFDNEHDTKQYVTFRSMWDSIMSRPEFQLPEATKFAYLRSHLGGRPLAVADRKLILGDDAYATTIR